MTAPEFLYLERLSCAPAALDEALCAHGLPLDLLFTRTEVDCSLRRSAQDFSDATHALVRCVPDRAARGRLLAARRAVHGGRHRKAHDVLELAARYGGSSPQGALRDAWEEGVRAATVVCELDALSRSLDERYAAAVRVQAEELPRQVAQALTECPPVMATLALASPRFYTELRRRGSRGVDGAPRSRLVRSLISYAARLAYKPSPFGAFCAIGFPGAIPAGEPATALRTSVVSSRPVARVVVNALARWGVDHGLRPVLAAPVGAVLTAQGPKALASQRYVRDGVFARLDEVVTGPCERSGTENGAGGGESVDSVDLDGDDDCARALAQELLTVPGVFDDGMRNDWAAVAAAVADGRLPAPPAAAAAVRSLATAVEELPGQDGDARVRTVRRMAGDVAAALAAVEHPVPSWVATTPLVHENSSVVVSPRSADELAPLAALRDHLRDRLAVDGEHLALRRLLVRRFGAGFCGVPLLETVYQVLPALRGQRSSAPISVPCDAALPAGGAVRSVLPPYWTAFVQPARWEGRTGLVLNQCHTGGIGLLARWGWLPDGREFCTRLAARATALAGGSRLLAFTAWSDWVDVQRVHLPGVEHLALPGDAPGQGADLWGELVLAHDATTDELVITDGRGRPVTLLYAGTVPQPRLSGVARVLARLSFPWAAVPTAEGPGPREQGPDERLVLRRASWTLPDDVRGAADDLRTFHDRLVAWTRCAGVPHEVFARPLRDGRPGGKPQWVDVALPQCVELVRHLIADGGGDVLVTEALPGHAGRVDDRVSELACLLEVA